MPSIAKPTLSAFALDVENGLITSGQKQISSRFFYDDLGSSLFEAITLLPEYGLTRADDRLLQTHAAEIVQAAGPIVTTTELGSGSGKKTRYILEALNRTNGRSLYRPIDVSAAALATCEKETNDLTAVDPVCADWLDGLRLVSSTRSPGPLLLLFLGSSIGNLERSHIVEFLQQVHRILHPGDLFLLGVDLVKDVDTMLGAYDDPTGVTAAFNLNILGRINRELGGDFDLRSFAHEVRWNADERRIEMHLLSGHNQSVFIRDLDTSVNFQAGETIWTEASNKFSPDELLDFSHAAGFETVNLWIDEQWPFAEVLWRVQ